MESDNQTTQLENAIYRDPTQPVEARVNDLVRRMTREEKVSQTLHSAPAIERLGIPAYNWWNECLHGVARAGLATVFPQAIGMAATWNVNLIHHSAEVISDEGRAKHHEALRQDIHDIYTGLTFWTPNINIFRDPRWGRGQETYGEDPYLTARLGVAFITGLQGDDPRYLKTVATPKHFAVHSGPEHARHHFNAQVDAHDLRETYLPAFEACIQEGQAASIMGAYNRTNDEPCCASPTLLQKILREEWGFKGYVVSDCWAIEDIYKHHKVVESAEEAAALAVKNGCDLNCGQTYSALLLALEKGLLDETTLNEAVKRLFTARFKLGMFDPPDMVPYAQIPYTVNASSEHRALARQMARESMVLLKNEANFLPLDKSQLKSIAVIGPNADDDLVLLSNYYGTPTQATTVLAGIQEYVNPEIEVQYAHGCDIVGHQTSDYDKALKIAETADVVIFVGGLSQRFEGEEGQQEGLPEGLRSQGDRTDINLPAGQTRLLKALHALGTPIVLILLNGSALAINWANEHLPAILEAWYPGEAGGQAIADVLFGEYNPAGRLPVTFYKSVDDLPPFEDYHMEGRTYRYFCKQPLYPFGYGLSYTQFKYSNLQLNNKNITPDHNLTISVDVKNIGPRAGDEVVQLYVSDLAASVPVPIRQLQGFQRIHLEPGETHTVTFTLTPHQLSLINKEGQRTIEPGGFRLTIGGRQPTQEDLIAQTPEICITEFEVMGKVTVLDK